MHFYFTETQESTLVDTEIQDTISEVRAMKERYYVCMYGKHAVSNLSFSFTRRSACA